MKPLYKWLIAIATAFVALFIVLQISEWLPERHGLLMSVMLVLCPAVIVWCVLDEFCDPEKVSP